MKDRSLDVVVVAVCAAVLVAVLGCCVLVKAVREIRTASGTAELVDSGWVEVTGVGPACWPMARPEDYPDPVCEMCGKVLDGSDGWSVCSLEDGDE